MTNSNSPALLFHLPAALQAQQARDAQGRGRLMASIAQEPCNAGLFAERVEQADMLSLLDSKTCE